MKIWERFKGIHNNFEIQAIIRSEQGQKYPEPPDFLTEEDIELLNIEHTLTSDKFWRMFVGSSSNLISYQDGLVELEITTSQQVLDAEGKPKWAIHNQIKSWGQEQLLSKARGYVAHIMLREKAVGFSCDANRVDASKLASALDEIHAPSPDLKTDEWRGVFEDIA